MRVARGAAFVAIVLVATVSGCGGKSDAAVIAEAKQIIKASCVRQGTGSEIIPGDKLDGFCECSSERVITELGAKGLRKMASDKPTIDPERLKAASVACFQQVVGG